MEFHFFFSVKNSPSYFIFSKKDAPKNLSPLVQTCFLPLLELIDAENLKAYLEINSSELEKIEKIDSTTSSQFFFNLIYFYILLILFKYFYRVWRGKWKGQSVASNFFSNQKFFP